MLPVAGRRSLFAPTQPEAVSYPSDAQEFVEIPTRENRHNRVMKRPLKEKIGIVSCEHPATIHENSTPEDI